MLHIKLNTLVMTFLNMFFLILFFAFSIDGLSAAVFLVWLNMMFYSYKDLGSRGMLFAFGIAFFTFLMGRELLERFFGYQVEDFSEDIIIHTDIVLLISLTTIFIFYIIFKSVNRKKNKKKIEKSQNSADTKYVGAIRSISLRMFYISVVLSIIYTFIVGYYVITGGYFNYYTGDFKNMISGNFIVNILDKVDQMLPIILSCYFATMPGRKSCNKVSIFYMFYLGLTLITGQRSTIVLGILWLFIYYLFRKIQDKAEKWINRRLLIMAIVAIPVGLIVLSLLTQWREGTEITFNGLFEEIRSFFYQQGVSVNVIKRSYQFENRLRADRLYSMEFLYDGILGVFTNASVFAGNTVEHATNGYSLAHALSYIMLGNKYLAGQGTGTSYIAELFHDFGYVGVILGNILYAYIMSRIMYLNKNRIFFTTIKLIIIQQLLWSPRGGFTGFISVLFTPVTLFTLFIIFVGAFILKSSRRIIKINMPTERYR